MRKLHALLTLTFLILLSACSATKYVPHDAYLLEKVKINSDSKEVDPADLRLYMRQNPNTKWFNLFKTQLYIYNLSGRDSTKWMNRFLRRIGDAPVLYSEREAIRTQEELTKAVQNMGYMSATVEKNLRTKGKKAYLSYSVHTGKPYTVRSINWDIRDEKIAELLKQDATKSKLHTGMLMNVAVLDLERDRITNYLSQNGYYRFTKDFITYTADSIKNSYQIDLTLHLHKRRSLDGNETLSHKQYRIGKVSFIADFDLLNSASVNGINISDSLHCKGFPIYFNDKLFLRPKILVDNNRIVQGKLYNSHDVQRTYENFGRLGALRYSNVRFAESEKDSTALSTYVLLTKNKLKSVIFEIDGTNTAGDLGAAAAVSFQHRNLFKGSETFQVKFRGAFEAISELQPGYRDNNYQEYGVEANLNIPRFLFPFLSSDYKKRLRATTEFSLQYNYQMRPEFTRTVASGTWSYKWLRKLRTQHKVDLLDVNYLYMPWISEKFTEDYLGDNANYIVEYNYKDRLIVNSSYNFIYNSGRMSTNPFERRSLKSSYSIRFGVEAAGNLLYAYSKLTNRSRGEDGEYALFNIPYAQYLKGDFDFSQTLIIDERNALAYHVGVGLAYPYGNAKLIPFEKRYFSGGANSVRGWSVRDLGPGSFTGDGNFMNQSGDIKIDASIEYRTKLFWKLQGAAFIDAGNIWTINSYENQPGGQFKFSKFYKEIAVAYGVGLRVDLDFFILRFDGGMKAINPQFEKGRNRYPIANPKFSRDFAFHFAIGYPF